LMRRLNEARKGASPSPQQPPKPAPEPTPVTPEDDLLRRIHEGAFTERTRNPKTALAPAEHIAWASRTGAPDGKPALEALLAIHAALDDDRLSAAERVLATPWLIEAEDILEAAGMLGGTPAPGAPGDVEALRAQVAALEAALEEQRTGRARAEARLAAVQAALAG